MRCEKLFETSKNEYCSYYQKLRYKFSINDKAKLDKYEKKIDVDLNLDTFFEDKYSCGPTIYRGDLVLLRGKASAYNFKTHEYEEVANLKYVVKDKTLGSNELRLNPEHLSEDHSIKIKVSYEIVNEYITSGFLHKRKSHFQRITSNDNISLECDLNETVI